MCKAACKVGCGCKKGYVRDEASGECIPKRLCGVVPMKSPFESRRFADEDSLGGFARNNVPFNTFADEDDDLGSVFNQKKCGKSYCWGRTYCYHGIKSKYCRPYVTTQRL